MNAKPVRSRKYTTEEVDRALLAMAVCGGNSARATGVLAAQGFKVSDRQLRYWRNDLYPDRYHKIADTHARQVEEVIITEAREVAFKAAEVEKLGLDATAAQIRDGTLPPKDVSAATRNASVTKGIATDTLLKMSGRPTVVAVETRGIDEILRKLSAIAPGVVQTIDSTAEELPAAKELDPAPAEEKADA